MSTQPNDGGPAFPQPMAALPTTGEMYCAYEKHPDFGGMTLRDYFAAAALRGYMANPEFCMGHDSPRNVAANCYDYADAMLAARDGKEIA
jgi:hypothetical protein